MFSNIPIPSLFICFIIFILWLHYEKAKSTRNSERASKEFWDREEKANHTRNQDISNLPLFQLPENEVPLLVCEDENVCYYQNLVKSCMEKPMMDLSEYTNTDLKLSYGVGNFKTLCEYDENFNALFLNLTNLSKAYDAIDKPEEAQQIRNLCVKYNYWKKQK